MKNGHIDWREVLANAGSGAIIGALLVTVAALAVAFLPAGAEFATAASAFATFYTALNVASAVRIGLLCCAIGAIAGALAGLVTGLLYGRQAQDAGMLVSMELD